MVVGLRRDCSGGGLEVGRVREKRLACDGAMVERDVLDVRVAVGVLCCAGGGRRVIPRVVRSVGSGGARAVARFALRGRMRVGRERWGECYSSRCSIRFFETLASVISSGIQSGLSSGACSFQAQPS